MAETQMSAVQVREILPHRYPFLLIDKVTSVEDGTITAIKCVSSGEPFFQGHFPELPIMPGVLILEAMAQAAILLAYHHGEFDPESQTVLFAGMDNVRFRRPVTPGDVLTISVERTRGGKIWQGQGRATVDGERAAEAQLLATVR